MAFYIMSNIMAATHVAIVTRQYINWKNAASVLFKQIWNRTRPRVLMQNQHTRELISAQNM